MIAIPKHPNVVEQAREDGYAAAEYLYQDEIAGLRVSLAEAERLLAAERRLRRRGRWACIVAVVVAFVYEPMVRWVIQ